MPRIRKKRQQCNALPAPKTSCKTHAPTTPFPQKEATKWSRQNLPLRSNNL